MNNGISQIPNFKEFVSIVENDPLSYNHKILNQELHPKMAKKESLHNFSNQTESDIDSAPELDPFFFDPGDVDHAKRLQTEGIQKLQNGDSEGVDLLENAAKLSPEDTDLFLRQGSALFRYGKMTATKKYLLLANKKFKRATKIDPDNFFSWKQWGECLLFLGTHYKDFHYFLEAKGKFETAILASDFVSKDEAAKLLWKYGQVMTEVAEQSGEVSDLNVAVESYAKAVEKGSDLPSQFWINYGNAALSMGIQINDVKLYMRAIDCHKQALADSLTEFESWNALASSLAHLYYLTHDEEHFTQANDCFTNAAKLHPQNDQIWLTWSKLLLSSGKRLRDNKRLHACIEKCHRCYTLGNHRERTLSIWAQALAHIGEITEHLELLYDAQNKVIEGIDAFGETIEMCFAHGSVLFCMGKFFQDNDFYYQAIEKFQEGLSLDRTNHKLWFYLGYAYAAVAEYEDNYSLYERSSKFFVRAINIQVRATYLFEYAKCLTKRAEFNRDVGLLETSILHFEQAFTMQKNAVFVHPEWLFRYAVALDLMGDLSDDEQHYIKSIEILQKVLMLDPDFTRIHYHLGLVYSHLGELSEEEKVMHRAISHFKIACGEDEENESTYLDWGLALINLAEMCHDTEERTMHYKDAEYKLMQAAKLGSTEALYHLCCLYSLTEQYEKASLFLEKAKHNDSLPPIDEMLEDDWMENFRNTEFFSSFINQLG